MEIEKSKCCSSKHIIVSVLIMLVVGLFFGVLGYLLGSKSNNVVSENNSTKNAVVNQNDGIEKERADNDEIGKIENIKDKTADWEIYENKEYSFSLTFPVEWKNYTVETPETNAGNLAIDLLVFGLEDQSNLFTIRTLW